MEIKELLRQLNKSRKELEQYVVSCIDKLPLAHSKEELGKWENYDKALDLGICLEIKTGDGFYDRFDILGCQGNELIMKATDEDLDDIDNLEFYPLDVLGFDELVYLACVVNSLDK